MTEARAQYLVSGLPGPNARALLVWSDPDFCEPTWEDVRKLVQHLGLTGLQIANLVGVAPRTVRKWLSSPEASNHSPIPYAAWRLLLIEAHLVEPQGVENLSAH